MYDIIINGGAVNDADIIRLSNHFHLRPRVFKRSLKRDHFLKIPCKYLVQSKDDKDKWVCSIHAIKPLICKTAPIAPHRDPDSGELIMRVYVWCEACERLVERMKTITEGVRGRILTEGVSK